MGDVKSRYSKNYKATIRTGDTAELYVGEGKGSGSERGAGDRGDGVG